MIVADDSKLNGAADCAELDVVDVPAPYEPVTVRSLCVNLTQTAVSGAENPLVALQIVKMER